MVKLKGRFATILQRIIKGRKLFIKMLTSYILIGIVPLTILSFITYKSISNFLIEDTIKNYSKSLEQTAFTIDQYIEKIYAFSWMLSDYNQLTHQIEQDPTEKVTSEYFDFVEEIRRYSSYYSGIDSIYVYHNNTVFSTDRGLVDVADFEDGEWCRRIMAKAREDYKYLVPYIAETREIENKNSSNGSDGSKVISVISPLGNRDFAKGMLVINIEETYFKQYLNQMKQDINDRVFIVKKENRNIISKSDSIDSDNASTESEIIQLIKNLDNGKKQRIINIGDKKVIVSFAVSKLNKWEYISFSDYNNVINAVDFVGEYTVVFVAILIALAMLISFIVVARLYAPIRNIINNTMNLNNRSDKDEISSIKDFINDIVIKNNTSEEFISKSLPSIKENMFMNLLKGSSKQEEEVIEKLSYCGIQFEHKLYGAIIIAIDNFSEFTKSYSTKERINIKYYILKIVEENLNEKFFAYGVEIDPEKICFIINIDTVDKFEKIRENFELIKQVLREEIDVTFTVGVGRLYGDIGSIRYSYLEALEAAKERFKLGENSFIYIGDIHKQENSFYTHLKAEEELANSIFSGEEVQISDIIRRIMEDARKNGLQSQKIKQILIEIISMIGRQLFKKGITYEEIFGDRGMLGELEKCETVTQYEKYIIEIMTLVSKHLRSSEGNDNNVVIKKVKEYINKNYMNDISLTQVAGIVMLSPSYLSTIFYKETRYNFLEYLNNVRIQQAREMLLDASYSIKEVSDKVGFTNYTTFSRVFKKFTGISASKYRIEKGIDVESDQDNKK